MAGPIGIYYINMTNIQQRYKQAFCDVLWWIYELRARSIELDILTSGGMKLQWQQNAVILEYLMPLHFLTFNFHLFQHIVDDILENGPWHSTWMFPTEGEGGIMKKELNVGN
jgi:hypothetical protein